MSTAGRCTARSTSSGTVVGPGMARNSRPARTLIRTFPPRHLAWRENSTDEAYRLPASAFPALDHAQRRIGQRHGAVLLHHLIARSHEAATWAIARQASLDHLTFHMDRVAGEYRLFHVELHVQEGEAGVLH